MLVKISRAWCSGEAKVLVADADAIRKFSAWKGTSGHKCCLECQNVVDFRSPYSHDPTGRNVPDTELDAAKFIPHNDDLAQVILQRVHDAKAVLSAVNFEEYKTRMSWNYVQRSAMQCPTCDFRLIACVMWDWAHIFSPRAVSRRRLRSSWAAWAELGLVSGGAI